MGRVREAVFSMLAPHIPGAVILDLFAGCGLLGLEALSRGAHSAFFVDVAPKAVQTIQKNVILCHQEDKCVTLRGSAMHPRTLETLQQRATQHHGTHKPFDLVFIDPPYGRGWVADTLQVLAQQATTEARFLAPHAVIVTEQEAAAEPVASSAWHRLQNRRYGDTRIVLWQSSSEGQALPPPMEQQQ